MAQAIQNENDNGDWTVSILTAVLFTGAIWFVYWINSEHYFMALNEYGVHPREAMGLTGIVSSVFLHGDLNHLYSNSAPLLVLVWGLVYFYRKLAFKVITFIVLFGGFWLWLFADQGSNHIGASGLIYGLGAFMFSSGLLRKKPELIAVSVLVLFLYGGMIWGVLPQPEALRISWEGHLFGAIAGVGLAINYRGKGPQRRVYSWEIEEALEEKMNAYFKDVTVEQLQSIWLQRLIEMQERQRQQQQYEQFYRYRYIPNPQGPESLDGSSN